MALIERSRWKRATASGGLTLTAPANEAFRIRGVFCVPSTNDDYLTLSVAGSTVGKVRVKGKAGNHAPYPGQYVAAAYEKAVAGIFALFRAIGHALDIPVESGQTFSAARYAETGEVSVLYDVFDPADVKRTEPNGSHASLTRFLHYMTNAAAITASPGTLGTSLMWTGGLGWPISPVSVPDQAVIRLLGILAAPVTTGSGAANLGYTTALVLLRNSDPILDDSGAGIPFVGDVAHTAASSSYKTIASAIGAETAELPTPAFILPDPIEFRAGERLTLQLALAGLSGAGVSASVADVALMLEVETKP